MRIAKNRSVDVEPTCCNRCAYKRKGELSMRYSSPACVDCGVSWSNFQPIQIGCSHCKYLVCTARGEYGEEDHEPRFGCEGISSQERHKP